MLNIAYCIENDKEAERKKGYNKQMGIASFEKRGFCLLFR
jgi:hypothetical protein